MPAAWGLYERRDFDAAGHPLGDAEMVVLPAEEADRERYEGKAGDGHHPYATFEYKGPAPAPGMEESVPDAVVAAAEVRRLDASAKAAEREFEKRQAALGRARARNERTAAKAAARAE